MGTRGFARDKPRELPASRRARLTLELAISLLLAGCNTGTYPVDVFPEMHYQAWHRPLEPERLTTPPEAVPVTGAPPLLTFAQAANLSNPIPRDPALLERARVVYLVNCASCHGTAGDGRGPVAAYYVNNPVAAVPPIALDSPRMRARTDGQLWWIIRNGLGNMPPYADLLTDEEVWLTVHFIRAVQGQ